MRGLSYCEEEGVLLHSMLTNNSVSCKNQIPMHHVYVVKHLESVAARNLGGEKFLFQF